MIIYHGGFIPKIHGMIKYKYKTIPLRGNRMKHRIVGDIHQLIAFELSLKDELLVFDGKLVFSKGNAELRIGTDVKPMAGLPPASLLHSPGGWGMAGIIPNGGGHIKRVDIGPPSGLIAASRSIFVLSKGVVAKTYEPSPEIAVLVGESHLVGLTGAGAAFLSIDGNFIEFTLGSDEELKADTGHIVGFSGGARLKPASVSTGGKMVMLAGPGNVILKSS
jgi:uncharacterized protein (AIM24 family)